MGIISLSETNYATYSLCKSIIMLYSLLIVAGSLSMAFGDDGNDNELVDRLMSNGYERTYFYVPPAGYERRYGRTYYRDPYARTYSNDEYYPSQHDKYPPMKPHDPKYPVEPQKTPKPTAWKAPKPKKTPKPTKAEKTPKPNWYKA